MTTKLSLNHLKPKSVTRVIQSPDGDEVEITLRILTDQQMLQINDSVPEAKPPRISSFNKDTKRYEAVENPDDPAYQKARTDVGVERTYRMMAACVEWEGLSDGTLEERAAALKKLGLPVWLLQALGTEINHLMGFADSDIQQRREQFR